MTITRQQAHKIYDNLPTELQQIINKYTRKWQYKTCVSSMHKSMEWRQTYTYRKYYWTYNSNTDNEYGNHNNTQYSNRRGICAQLVTPTNRAKYDIADSLRYQDFISDQGLVRKIVPIWRQFHIEPSIRDIVKLPYSTNVLAYAFKEYLAMRDRIADPMEIKGPDYYARDMLYAVACDLVDSIQLMTWTAKRRQAVTTYNSLFVTL